MVFCEVIMKKALRAILIKILQKINYRQNNDKKVVSQIRTSHLHVRLIITLPVLLGFLCGFLYKQLYCIHRHDPCCDTLGVDVLVL